MNWRDLLSDRDTALREIEDLKFTCAHEGLKIVFGLLFILFSSYALYSLVGAPPKTDAEWRVFALFFSLFFSLLMFGLSLLITALTSNAAKTRRNHDELNGKIDRLLQERGINIPAESVTEPQHHDETDVLISIRDNSKGILDYLKDPKNEYRALTFSNTILAFVAAIVALVALGKDLYIENGLPLQPLWIGLLCLLLGGVFSIYYEYSKWKPALLVIGVSVIGILYVVVLILTAMSFGVHAPPPTTGNITNIYENCSYPITTVVNNYNITVIENYSDNKNPSVSIEELKYLMGSHK